MRAQEETTSVPVAVISGSRTGIGKALSDLLHRQGYRVYGLSRSLPRHLPSEKPQGAGVYSLPLDVRDPEATQAAMQRILQIESRLDLLILAAGYGLAGPVEETKASEASQQLATNVIGTSTLLEAALPFMREKGSGRIVFLGSVAAVIPIPFQAYYSASKAAITALAHALRDEVRPFGLEVCVVLPGDTKTEFTQSRVFCQNSPPDSVYAGRLRRSIAKMEEDERSGMSAEKMARLISKRLRRSRLPFVYTPGAFYRLAVFLCRILPLRLVRAFVAFLYAR